MCTQCPQTGFLFLKGFLLWSTLGSGVFILGLPKGWKVILFQGTRLLWEILPQHFSV